MQTLTGLLQKMLQAVLSFVAHLYSSETWKIIEITSKVIGIFLGVGAALCTGINYLAGQSATFLEAEPRAARMAAEPPQPQTSAEPFSVIVVSYGLGETEGYADALASALPPGSVVYRVRAQAATISDRPKEGVGYSSNGNDTGPLKKWLAIRHIAAVEVDNPYSFDRKHARFPTAVTLFVWPKK